MYGLTAKQIKMRGIVSLVLGVIFLIVSIFMGSLALKNMTDVALLILEPLVIAWMIFAITLNWKSILKGLIKPIPFVSYCVEYFKALLVMSPKALFWAMRQKEE